VRPDEDASPTVGSLPATFTGLVPCPDCWGIRYQINLVPGAAYLQRMTYLLDGHDDSYYEVGAWSVSRGGTTLTLEGGRKGDTYWAVTDPSTLRKLDAGGNPVDRNKPHELKRSPVVEPMAPRARLLGMFRSMADAPRFRECRSGLEWPVAMSDDYRTLEHAYASRRSAPGAELLVSVQGRIEPLPKREGDGREPTLVVEEFVSAMPGERCGGGDSRSGLEDNRWRPIRIGDETVTLAEHQSEPWIEFDPKAKRVTGSGGCNRISGSYEVQKRDLRIGPLAATRMACPSMGIETAFFRALQATRHFRVSGRVLDLLDEGGGLLVRLEERNLR